MKIIAIVGPTATGKSDLAIATALKNNGEVINADAMQLYKHMDIGTAKVGTLEMQGVKHHLLSCLEPCQEASVSVFQKEARKIITRLSEQSITPIIAGGSGLYVKAILDKVDFPGFDQGLRQKVEQMRIEDAYAELKKINPLTAGGININNKKRVYRALEASLQGKYISKMPDYQYYYPEVQQIGLMFESLDDAQTKISQRVDKMFANGLVDEVKNLQANYNLSRTAREAIGYKQILEHLHNPEQSIDEVKDLIKLRTFQLYKKQIKWFKRDERIEWRTV